jgi:hypothetical protein
MLQLFFDSYGIVHTDFIREGETVNEHCYKEILCHLYTIQFIISILSFGAGKTRTG